MFDGVRCLCLPATCPTCLHYVLCVYASAGAWSTFSGMGRSRSRTFPELAGVSLGVFTQENRFRQAVYDTVTSRWVEVIAVAVVAMSVCRHVS